uniref:C-type lectin domain-containing protein n=1 Tax=Sphenodon punctatus TaxID=8508 RepID=A0A8D0G2I9_SPHPU
EQGAGSQDSWVLVPLGALHLSPLRVALVDSICKTCPPGWFWFQRKCYYFSQSTQTWAEAKTVCALVRARLVVIDSQEKQEFLKRKRPKSRVHWLGLSDQKTEGKWLWVDGRPLELSFWSSGEPNNSNKEDCASMDVDGRWNDLPCTTSDYWICEMPWVC